MRRTHRVFVTLAAFAAVTTSCSREGGGIVKPQVETSAPVPKFTPSAFEGDAPVMISFTDQSTGTISSWSWDFGDGSEASSERNPKHTYAAMGRYVVRLTVKGPSGATATAERKVTINKVVSVTTGSVRAGPFWPTRTQGDCDFAGHGPEVDADVRLSISGDRQRLLLYPHMKAVETASDWSTAESRFLPVTVLTLPAGSGLLLKSVVSSTTSSVHFSSGGHEYHNIAGSTDLASFSILADTEGDDLCNRTSDDTHMYVWIHNYAYRVGP